MNFKIILIFFVLILISGCTDFRLLENNLQNKSPFHLLLDSFSGQRTGHFISTITLDAGHNFNSYITNISKINAVIDLCKNNECIKVGSINTDISKTSGLTALVGESDIEPGLYQLKMIVENKGISNSKSKSGSSENSGSIEYNLGQVTILQDKNTIAKIEFEDSSLSLSNSEKPVISELKTIIIDAINVDEKPIVVEGETYNEINLKGNIKSITETYLTNSRITETVSVDLPSKDFIDIDIKDESDLTVGTLIISNGKIETFIETKPIETALKDIIQEISAETLIPINKIVSETNIKIVDDVIEKDEAKVLDDTQKIIDKIDRTALAISEQNIIKDKEKLAIDVQFSENKINADASLSNSEKLELNNELNKILENVDTPAEIKQDISELENIILQDSIAASNPDSEKQNLEIDINPVEQDLLKIEKDEQTAKIDSNILQDAKTELEADLQTLNQDEDRLEVIIADVLQTGEEIQGTETSLNEVENMVSEAEEVIDTAIQEDNTVEISSDTSIDSSPGTENTVSTSSSSSDSSSSASVSVGI